MNTQLTALTLASPQVWAAVLIHRYPGGPSPEHKALRGVHVFMTPERAREVSEYKLSGSHLQDGTCQTSPKYAGADHEICAFMALESLSYTVGLERVDTAVAMTLFRNAHAGCDSNVETHYDVDSSHQGLSKVWLDYIGTGVIPIEWHSRFTSNEMRPGAVTVFICPTCQPALV